MKNQQNKMRHIHVPVTDFKYDQAAGEFSCYANVFNVVDHVRDRSVKGCFKKSIERHLKGNTMPKMFWMHNPFELPVGTWFEMREDEKGLFMRGRLSKTSKGTDIEILAKDGALDSFSIGYIVIEERKNHGMNCNDLIEIDVKEVSWVNFACNEASTLQSIKAAMDEGKTPTKAELREILDSVPWLSKRQIERITANYKPSENDELKNLIASTTLFS